MAGGKSRKYSEKTHQKEKVKILRISFLLFLSLITAVISFVYYAKAPAISEQKFKSQDIVTFSVAAPHFVSELGHLQVVTYNIGYGSGIKNNQSVAFSREEIVANLERMVTDLKILNPDVVFLQEVDFNSARSFGINQLEYLAQNLGLAHAAYAVTWNKKYIPWPYWPISVHFGRMVSGQAILSAFPIVSQSVYVLERPPHPFWYNWFYLERLAQKVKVKIADQNITLWNLHLEAFHKPTRFSQAAIVANLINQDKAKGAVIVGGDFNDPQRRVKSKNAFYHLTKKTGFAADREFNSAFTWPSWAPKKKLDHILLSPELKLIQAGTLQSKASDHLPVWAELEFH